MVGSKLGESSANFDIVLGTTVNELEPGTPRGPKSTRAASDGEEDHESKISRDRAASPKCSTSPRNAVGPYELQAAIGGCSGSAEALKGFS